MVKVRKIGVALICGLAVAILAGADAVAQKPTQTITGKIVKAEDVRGKVISVFIDDPERGKFLAVRSTEVGKELLKQVGATVKATGYVKKTRPESKYAQLIDVLSYEVVPPQEKTR